MISAFAYLIVRQCTGLMEYCVWHIYLLTYFNFCNDVRWTWVDMPLCIYCLLITFQLQLCHCWQDSACFSSTCVSVLCFTAFGDRKHIVIYRLLFQQICSVSDEGRLQSLTAHRLPTLWPSGALSDLSLWYLKMQLKCFTPGVYVYHLLPSSGLCQC